MIYLNSCDIPCSIFHLPFISFILPLQLLTRAAFYFIFSFFLVHDGDKPPMVGVSSLLWRFGVVWRATASGRCSAVQQQHWALEHDTERILCEASKTQTPAGWGWACLGASRVAARRSTGLSWARMTVRINRRRILILTRGWETNRLTGLSERWSSPTVVGAGWPHWSLDPDLPSPTSNSGGGTGTGTSSGKSSSALLAIELVE
jgi:hypothetical protein